MIAIARKLFLLLAPGERRNGVLLLALVLVMALVDMLGVASILPFVAVLSSPDLMDSNPLLVGLKSMTGISDPQDFLRFIGIAVFVLLIVSLAIKALTTYAQLRFTLMAEYSLGRRMLEGYLHQPYVWFLNRHSADIGKTILSEVTNVVHTGLIPLLSTIAQGAVALSLGLLLFFTDPMLSVTICMTLGLAYVLIYRVLRGRLSRLGELRLAANQQRFTAITETFTGIKEVKASGLEQFYVGRFARAARDYAEHNTAANIVSQLPRYMMEALAFGGLMLIILFLMGREGEFVSALPIIALYAFAGYRLMPALQQVYTGFAQLRFVGPALDVLYADMQRLGAPPSQDSSIGAGRLALGDAITLSDIQFAYPNAPASALHGINLAIPARTTIGFVGPTGSGKTTLVDIILGLIEPQVGVLAVDGQPISSGNRRAWQRTIGYVPQQIHLTDDTIAANIAFGVPFEEIDMAAVERAGRIAHLDAFVQTDLPVKYLTVIGEQGVRLSGGQRQRIGIARALYHNPSVLILDEATSALDNLTEQAVMEAVNALRSDITIILIAHRLTTVRACDQIVMLEKGRVVGQGTYTELLGSNDRFRTMAEMKAN